MIVIRAIVTGAGGRMGGRVLALAKEADDFQIVGATERPDHPAIGRDAGEVAVLQGLDASDSLILDPHKTLFLPYGSGSVLVKDGQKMYAANRWHADYTQDVPEEIEELSPSDLS